MDCRRCTQPNPENANFCLNCGQRLAQLSAGGPGSVAGSARIASIGTGPARARAGAASARGGRLSSMTRPRSGERKQVTVLFADTVRSTELVSRIGAEAFRELMNDLFSLARGEVERFGGHINQLLGDGFMALFGALAAHEDHTRRAALAAAGVRSRVRRSLAHRGVELRIGIASGLAVVDTIGEGDAAALTAFGEVTVLAARLQALAEPGQVLLTTADADRLRRCAGLESVGEFMVDGVAVRIERLCLIDERSSGNRFEACAPAQFVGRTAELDGLLRLLAEVGSAAARAVHIVGDAGAGKSRLLFEFARAAGVRAIEGRCMSYGSEIPYLPIAELVRETCRIRADDSPAAIAEKVRRELDRAGLDADADAVPLLLDLVGQRPESDPLAALDPATIKGRTFDVLVRLWRAETRLEPMLLLVEDLHWIDPTSEEFLAALVADPSDRRLIIVTTCRPGYRLPWQTDPRLELLHLGALADEASRAIVAAVVPCSLEPARIDAIVARAEGNPFFLEELARAGAEGGHDVPRTVRDVLAARLEGLGDAPKQLAQTASVLGREFSLRALRELWRGRAALGGLLRQLQQLGLLAPKRRDRLREYGFRHALTHEVAYASLLERHRRNLHGRAAAVLEELYAAKLEEHCEILAYHYARSDDAGKAVRFLAMANRKAAARNAMEEAIAYFYQALQAIGKLEDNESNRRMRLQLVFDQTGEFHFLHRHQEYHDLLLAHEPLVRAVDDENLGAVFAARLGHRQWTSGNVAASVSTLERAAAACVRAGNDEHAASAHAILAWAHLFRGDYAEVPRARDRAFELLARRFDPVWYSFACAAAILAHTWRGRWNEAVEAGRYAVEAGRARGDGAIVSFNTSWISHAYLLQCDWARAREHALFALEQAPTVYFRGFPQAMLARAMCGLGQCGEGVAMLGQLEPVVRASGHRPAWALIGLFLGEAYLEIDDKASARAVLESVRTAGRDAPMSFFLARSSRLLGQIALDDRRYEEAGRDLDEARHEAARSGALNEMALTLAAQGRLQGATGQVAAARRRLRQALSMLVALGTAEEPERVSREIAALPAG